MTLDVRDPVERALLEARLRRANAHATKALTAFSGALVEMAARIRPAIEAFGKALAKLEQK